ncbi:hypothetical protein Hanom_Chr05g00406501 [Helianthus anomalus]
MMTWSRGIGWWRKRVPESTKLWMLKYDAVKAISNNAHRNMVVVEVKQRWKERFMVWWWVRSILILPGVEGKMSSSNGDGGMVGWIMCFWVWV